MIAISSLASSESHDKLVSVFSNFIPMPTEDMELIVESDLDRRQLLWSKTSIALGVLGWLIIGSTLNTIIFNSFPLKLASSEWLLALIASLLSSSFAFLVGAALISLALLFDSDDQVLQKWQHIVSRLAGWFAILIVLMIPLQFFLGALALKGKAISAKAEIDHLKGVAKRVGAVNSESEFRAYLTSLPTSPTLPPVLDAPFPVVKQRAIDNVTAQINTAMNNIEIQKSQGLQLFLTEAIRNTAKAILMAAAFSALAQLSVGTKNVVTKFFCALI